jgi:hypothetical protein
VHKKKQQSWDYKNNLFAYLLGPQLGILLYLAFQDSRYRDCASGGTRREMVEPVEGEEHRRQAQVQNDDVNQVERRWFRLFDVSLASTS